MGFTKLALSSEIDADYKFLYAYISYRCSTRGYMWFQNETLADHMGKSTRAIERGLKKLSEKKYLYIEQRVKKGALYHQDMRRVIWIYSDYLLALDKGGYGVAKPLPFRRWKQRFINALLDQSKISMILYFFPTLEFMGTLNISYEANEHKLYKYSKFNNEWKTEILTKVKADEAYEKIYNFYCDQHKEVKESEESDDLFKNIGGFNDLQAYIRTNYINKVIAKINGIEVTVNELGMLMMIQPDKSQTQLNVDNAMEVWQWLFSNQEQLNKKV